MARRVSTDNTKGQSMPSFRPSNSVTEEARLLTRNQSQVEDEDEDEEDDKEDEEDEEVKNGLDKDTIRNNDSTGSTASSTGNDTTRITPIKRRDVDIATEKMRVSRTLPKPPGRSLSFDDLQKYLSLFNDDMWSHVLVYVYRHKPVIVRQKVDATAKNYIDVLSGPFTKEDIISSHGGGKYGFKLVDTDLSKGANICEARLDISMSEYDPKLDYRELDVTARENKGYIESLVARKVIDRDGNVLEGVSMAAQQSNPTTDKLVTELFGMVKDLSKDKIDAAKRQANTPDEVLMTKTIEMMSKASETQMTALTERMKSESPDKLLTLVTTVLGFLDKAKPADNSGNMQMEMMKFMIEQNNRNMEMQKDFMKMMVDTIKTKESSRGEEDGDEISKLEKLLNIAKMIKGGGGSGEDAWWETALKYGGPILSNIAGSVANAMAFRATGKMPPQQAPQQQPSYYTNAGALPAPATTGEATTAMSNNEVQDDIQMLQQYGGHVLQNMANGVSGFEFAENLVAFFGGNMQVYGQIATRGKDRIIAAMKAVPEFWQQAVTAMVGEHNVVTWVDEFCRYPELAQQEQGEVIEPEEVPPVSSPQAVFKRHVRGDKKEGN